MLLTLGRLKTLQTFQTFCQLNYSIIILTKKISSGLGCDNGLCHRDGGMMRTCGHEYPPVFHVPVTICSEVWKPFCWYKYQCDIWYPPSKEKRSHHGRSMNNTKQRHKTQHSSVKYFIFPADCINLSMSCFDLKTFLWFTGLLLVSEININISPANEPLNSTIRGIDAEM